MRSLNVSSLLNWVPADPFTDEEVVLWERLSRSKRAPLEPAWLGEIYSLSLSVDLRRALCEKLGMQAERGWPVIQDLLASHGVLPELVMAAGLCHQSEARDWLLAQLEQTSDNEDANLMVVQALACWGAEVPESVVVIACITQANCTDLPVFNCSASGPTAWKTANCCSSAKRC